MRFVRRRPRAAGSIVLAVILATLAGHGAPSHAQPSAPDLPRARQLYHDAEIAMKDGRYADAARDYGAAYDITKDPVLFFKLGSANDRGKKCNVALIYYRRYLREAQPKEDFVRLTRGRIAACGGNPDDDGPAAGSGPATPSDAGSGTGDGTGSAAVGRGGADVEPDPELDVSTSAGSAAPPPSARPVAGHRLAWLLVGGALATFTAGAVLAYSANASERDVEDLYVGIGGTPPVFDANTQARFDDLVAEGKRYEKLSWVAFGLAGALGVAATVRFVTDREPATEVIAPVVTPDGAGVTATLRF